MKKRRVVLLTVLFGLLIIQSIQIYALQRSVRIPDYENQTEYTTNLQPYASITFRNGISADKHEAGAESWSNYPFTRTSVNATFYWNRYDMNGILVETGTTYLWDGHDGCSSVEVPSTSGTRKYYYQVVSNHSADCNGPSISYPNLTTFVP